MDVRLADFLQISEILRTALFFCNRSNQSNQIWNFIRSCFDHLLIDQQFFIMVLCRNGLNVVCHVVFSNLYVHKTRLFISVRLYKYLVIVGYYIRDPCNVFFCYRVFFVCLFSMRITNVPYIIVSQRVRVSCYVNL